MDWWNARPHPCLLPREGEIISAFLKIHRAWFTRLVWLQFNLKRFNQGQSPRQAHNATIPELNFWDSTRSKRRRFFKLEYGPLLEDAGLTVLLNWETCLPVGKR